MGRHVAGWSLIAAAACGSPPPPPAAAPPSIARATAEPHRATRPPAPNDPLRDVLGRGLVLIGRPDPSQPIAPRLRAIELPSERKSDYWSPCVRAFVQTQPEVARELLGEALSRYGTACSAAPPRVEFVVPRAGRTGAPIPLALVGTLEATRGELALRAEHRGERLRAERIALVSDGATWTSPRLDFDDAGGGELALVPVTRAVGRDLRRAVDARDTSLRFEGALGHDDVAIGDDVKQELRAMLDALDAINRP